MNVGGPSGASFHPIASSAAGSSNRHGHVDQDKQASAEQKFQVDQKDRLERTVTDVGDAEQLGDRDADGREAWHFRQPAASDQDEPADTNTDAAPNPPADDDDETLGRRLDVEV